MKRLHTRFPALASCSVLLGFVTGVTWALIMAAGTTVRAQVTNMLLTDDFAGPTCAPVSDISGVPVTFYITIAALDMRGIRFRVVETDGFAMTYVGEDHPWPQTSGDLRNGIEICLPECSFEYITLARITYVGTGLSAYCSSLRLGPHPLAETIEDFRCQSGIKGVRAYHSWVNGGIDCPTHPCPGTLWPDPVDPAPLCGPVPVAHTTWGAVKALYR